MNHWILPSLTAWAASGLVSNVPTLTFAPAVWAALTVSRACGAPRVTTQLIDLSWVELGLDRRW